MDIIKKYFGDFTDRQLKQFAALEGLYNEWNAQINVISRKDIEQLYTRHILHSLAISCVIDFKPGTKIVDVGCGGGFPGIPLAIFFPEVQFTMVDSIGKKIKVVEEVSKAIGLENITAVHGRAESLKDKYDFVVSRAVTAFPKFVSFTRNLVAKKQQNALPNGILYLKGGDFEEELKPFRRTADVMDISDFFEEEFFETKKIIYLPIG